MAYPPGPVAADKTNETDTPDDHKDHHNDLAAAVNDIVDVLGADPAGGEADVGARFDASDVVLADKVTGPASVTDDLPAVFDSTTGKLIKQKTYAAFKTLLVLVKSDVGLGNVDNTSDANKPVSSATQTALDLKANLASPTFTGTVAGITKSMVGLGNVDNTADAAKPVSTATQTALDLKANLASPALTGNPTAPTQSAGNNSTRLATTAYADAKVAETITNGVTGIAPSQDAVFDALAAKADASALADYVTKALYDANSILIATADNTPLALTIAASRILGRKASGDIDDMTGAETAAILAGEVFKQAQETNAQTGTTYTLVAGDAGKLVTLSNASGITLTLPQDSDATIAIGTYVDLYQLGAGQVTVAAGTGATLRTSGLTAKARSQYARLGVQKVSANTWSLFGDLAAS